RIDSVILDNPQGGPFDRATEAHRDPVASWRSASDVVRVVGDLRGDAPIRYRARPQVEVAARVRHRHHVCSGICPGNEYDVEVPCCLRTWIARRRLDLSSRRNLGGALHVRDGGSGRQWENTQNQLAATTDEKPGMLPRWTHPVSLGWFGP